MLKGALEAAGVLARGKPMKVFLSWSGEVSKQAALALYGWLPTVIQTAKPYMSAESIDKGERWSVDIAKQLEETHFGIICVTPDNKSAPWILFEAGALSKSMERARVSPLAFGVLASDFTNSPLLQFQFTLFKKDEVRKLLYSINEAAPDGERLSKEILDRSFERAWTELEEDVAKIKFHDPAKNDVAAKAVLPTSNLDATLDELLTIARSQIKLLHSPEELFPIAHLRRATLLQRPQRLPRGFLHELSKSFGIVRWLSRYGTKRDQDLHMELFRLLRRCLDYAQGTSREDWVPPFADAQVNALREELAKDRRMNDEASMSDGTKSDEMFLSKFDDLRELKEEDDDKS